MFAIALASLWNTPLTTSVACAQEGSTTPTEENVRPPSATPTNAPDDVANAPSAVVLEELVRLFATGGVAGELATPHCTDAMTLEAAEIARSQIWASELAHDREAGLMIDTGGLFARHGLARFASSHDPGALAELAESLGFHAFAFSEVDLSDPRPLVLARAEAISAPILASNLHCRGADGDGAQEICAALRTANSELTTFERNGERIALFSYLDPEAATRVGPDRMEGLAIGRVVPSVRRDVRRAREEVDVIIAIIDGGSGARGLARVSSWMRELEPEDRPDLVLVSRAGTELVFARPADFRPALIAAPTRGASDVDVRRDRERGRFDVLSSPAERDAPAHAAFVRFIERVGPAYCEALGQPLAGGRIDADHEDGAFDADDVIDLVAASMRESTGTDIAIVNEGAIDERWTLGNGEALTASDVNIAVQYDEPLVRATVPAFWIRTLARENPESQELRALGVTISGAFTALERVKVNGRPLDDDAFYDVVTIRFVAEHGDGYALPDAEWEPTGRTLREVVLDHLTEAREVDPRDSFDDPWDDLEWTLRTTADLTFSGSAVRDRSGYGEGPLQNANQLQLGLAASVHLGALSRLFAWENDLTLDYTRAATTGSDGFVEGNDQLLYRTSLTHRGLRDRRDEIYVPDPYAEGLLRTELTAGQDRDIHFMSARFAAGFQWRPHLRVKLRLLAGVEIVDALDADARTVAPGFGVQWLVSSWTLMREGMRRLIVELRADYFLSGIATSAPLRHLLQGEFNLAFHLNRYLGISLDISLYGLQVDDGPFAFATQTTAGFRVQWTGRRVMR